MTATATFHKGQQLRKPTEPEIGTVIVVHVSSLDTEHPHVVVRFEADNSTMFIRPSDLARDWEDTGV